MRQLSRVLYIEDDMDIQAVARFALVELGGFIVALAASGREALDMVAGFNPDLVLLDVMMPEMDGPTTFAELRRLPGTARTPIVFITAKAQAHELKGFNGLGAAGIIVKPFDPMVLADRVRLLWNQALAQECAPCPPNP